MTGSRAFLADFGLAKTVATHSRLTRSGVALGTPAYMSPEQARGEVSSLTPATDVWSLGCVLYEILAGRPSWEANTTPGIIAKVLLQEPPPLRRLRPEVPSGLERAVRQALAKRAARRYADGGVLREELDRVLRGERPRARVPGRRGTLLGIAALLGSAGGAALLARGLRPDPPAPMPSVTGLPATATLAQRARALRSSDPLSAAECLRQALALDPGRDDLRVERGLLLWALGRGDAAREEWGLVPPGSRESAAVAQLYLGLELFFRSVEHRVWWDVEARAPLERLQAAPGPQGRLALGVLLAAKREWTRAREALAGVGGWEADLLRGYVEGTDPEGDRRAAVRHYDSALEAGLPFPWVYVNRSTARECLGDFGRALADSERALVLDGGLAAAWGSRGNAKRGAGDLEGAQADYVRSLGLDPGNATTWGNLGLVRRELGDAPGAVVACDEALARDATALQPLLNRALARQALGDTRGAIEDYGRILDRDDRNVHAWANRGAERAKLGDLAGGISDLDRALALDPGCAVAWSNRGMAKQQSGELEAALADLDRAVALEPDYAFGWANRGETRAALGDWAGAASDLQRALQVAPNGWPHRALIEQRLASVRKIQERREAR
ncbi:MAG: tetratricopeptide repeat-containing serine/threonine-protein kinase [Planctomycetales bacterium]|nr:tetratricopeptide repeat-containing serine/threonine-protein kinase [Planctomycetales bacterium]